MWITDSDKNNTPINLALVVTPKVETSFDVKKKFAIKFFWSNRAISWLFETEERRDIVMRDIWALLNDTNSAWNRLVNQRKSQQ